MQTIQSQAWDAVTSETMSALIKRRALHTEHATVARFELGQDAVVGRHAHPNEQISTVLKGALRLEFDDRHVVVRPGEVIVIPPDVPHAATALEDTVVLDFFSPRREDWIRHDDGYLRR